MPTELDPTISTWERAGYIGRALTKYGQMLYFTNDTGAVSRSLAEYGEWAQQEIDFLIDLVRPGMVVVDVGAYIGTHTIALAAAVGPKGAVHAFEPQVPSYRLLTANLEANGILNVIAHREVVSKSPGEITLREIDISTPTSYGSQAVEEHTRGRAASVVTLDDVGLNSCGVIKVDAEGMESDVVCGARVTIQRNRPVVYAECNSVEKGALLIQRYRELGYRCYAHVADAFNPHNWNGLDENHFGSAKEIALVGFPPGQDGSRLLHKLVQKYVLLPCETLDDIVYSMLLKPQYPFEVLLKSKASHLEGTRTDLKALFQARGEVDACQEFIAALRAESSEREERLRESVEREEALRTKVSEGEERLRESVAREEQLRAKASELDKDLQNLTLAYKIERDLSSRLSTGVKESEARVVELLTQVDTLASEKRIAILEARQLQANLAYAHQVIGAEQARVNTLETQIGFITNSKIWRMTTVLRWLRSRLSH